MTQATESNLRNALDVIRVAAGLHYMGGAFDPEHMRSIANIATRALNGDTFRPIDYEGARERAKVWERLLEEDDA